MKHLETQGTVEATVDTGQAQVKPGSHSKKRRTLLISIIALLCISIICGAFLYNGKFFSQAAKGGQNAKPHRLGPIHSFEPFIVNIAGTHATRYLRVCINVECSSKKAHTKIVENELRIRDRILDLLCAQSIEELLDVSERDNLRSTMADTIREAIVNGEDDSQWVRSVYFSEFTIQ